MIDDKKLDEIANKYAKSRKYEDRDDSIDFSIAKSTYIAAYRVAESAAIKQQNKHLKLFEESIRHSFREREDNMKKEIEKLQAKIKQLEDAIEIQKHTILHTDDCYYWTPHAWEEFKRLKRMKNVQNKG